jgi:cell division septal protein FtsQ
VIVWASCDSNGHGLTAKDAKSAKKEKREQRSFFEKKRTKKLLDEETAFRFLFKRVFLFLAVFLCVLCVFAVKSVMPLPSNNLRNLRIPFLPFN